MALSASQSGREAIRTKVQTTTPAAVDIADGAGVGIPNDGFDVKHRSKKAFIVTTTGACDIYIQTKARAAGTFGVLQKEESDGDRKWSLIANESVTISHTTACRYERLWIQNTASADITVTVEHVGGP